MGRLQSRLRQVRADAGITQQQLAEKVGVSRQTINAIEGGKYSPSLEVAFLLAEALKVKLERIFWFEAG